MFSIVMPLYNKEQSCPRAINSIRNQTFSDWELIIVNDGSSDNSLTVAKEAAQGDPRIRFIDQPNGGVSVARNNGIKAAKHEHIAFLDADDAWRHAYLEIMSRVVKDHPDYLWWGSRVTAVEGDREMQRLIQKEDAAEYQWDPEKVEVVSYFEASVFVPCVQMGSIIMNKSAILDIGGFPEGVRFGEDVDTCARLALKSKLPLYQQALTYWIMGAENSCCTQVASGKMPNTCIPFLEKNLDMVANAWGNEDPEYWQREFICNWYLDYEISRYEQGAQSRRDYMAAIKNCKFGHECHFKYRLAVLRALVPWSMIPLMHKTKRIFSKRPIHH